MLLRMHNVSCFPNLTFAFFLPNTILQPIRRQRKLSFLITRVSSSLAVLSPFFYSISFLPWILYKWFEPRSHIICRESMIVRESVCSPEKGCMSVVTLTAGRSTT